MLKLVRSCAQKRNFFLTMQAKNISNVTIIGGGLMGSGIAQVSAQSGYNVTVVDQNDKILQNTQSIIQKSLERVAKKKFPNDSQAVSSFLSETMSKVRVDSNLSSAVKDADLVCEAIVENLEAKQDLFKQLEEICNSSCIFATNTSSLSLSDIMDGAIKRQDKFGGLHFFNPVPVMRLVEVIRQSKTSDETFHTLTEYGKKIGKVTVTCKDTPGFIVNRLLLPYMMEALRMAERGDATTLDIDMAMKLGAGYPMGPFELADYVGLDTMKFIIDGWHKKFPEDPLMSPSEMLNKLVSEGKLGKKTGEGFYKH